MKVLKLSYDSKSRSFGCLEDKTLTECLKKTDYENQHSERLAQILKYKDNGKYVVLDVFMKKFFPKSNKSVKRPEIKTFENNIDISVKDVDFYLIFENKVNQAKDQPNQVERYIKETLQRDRNLQLDNIYVLYLAQTKDHTPKEQVLGKYKDKLPQNHYTDPTCKDTFLPWLNSLRTILVSSEYQNILLTEIDSMKRSLEDKNNL